jgi:hypothetical protein
LAILDYEELVQQFETSLQTQLRGHNNDAGFLEVWVPDPDPVNSILNMVESAELSGMEGFDLRVRQSTLGGDGLARLKAKLHGLSALSESAEGRSHLVLRFSGIGRNS